MTARRTKIEIRQISASNKREIEAFTQWAAEAEIDPEVRGAAPCRSISRHLQERGRPDYEVNYAVLLDGRLIGGVLTSGEHFNVIWIHWAETRSGIGQYVTREILQLQFADYGRASVNQPNAKMCMALRKILRPEVAGELHTGMTVDLKSNDLMPDPNS